VTININVYVRINIAEWQDGEEKKDLDALEQVGVLLVELEAEAGVANDFEGDEFHLLVDVHHSPFIGALDGRYDPRYENAEVRRSRVRRARRALGSGA